MFKAFLKFYLLPLLMLGCITFSCTKKAKPAATNSILDSITGAQKNPYSMGDQSPMDMSYFPEDYPLHKMNKEDSLPPVIRVIYSRPHKKNRLIFGKSDQSLCPYGKPWRLGANEATEITFFKNVSINGKNISKGSYVIYCIPFQDKWTVVLNTNLYTWGLHIDDSKDIFKTDLPLMEQSPALEDFTMTFISAKYGADLLMTWDNVKCALPIEFSRK